MIRILAILALTALDQLTKALAVRNIGLEQSVWFFNEYAGLGLSAYLNPGNILGAPLPPLVFAVIGMAVVAVGTVISLRPEARTRTAATILAVAGALGNTLDRLRFGAVVDWIGPGWVGVLDIPIVVNLADVMLATAIALFMLRR